MITTNVVIEQNKRNKHTYQINYSYTIFVCRKLLTTQKQKFSNDVEILIKRELLPIRTDRAYPRKVCTHSAISFIYKIY